MEEQRTHFVGVSLDAETHQVLLAIAKCERRTRPAQALVLLIAAIRAEGHRLGLANAVRPEAPR